MGWRSLAKNGEIRYEDHPNLELGGRPVAQGEEGNLLFIEQEDYGHRVGIDLRAGVILIDYDEPTTYQNGTLEIHGTPKAILWMTDETSFVGEMQHIETTYELKRDEKGRKIHDENGKLVQTKTDNLIPLTFRPIWFTRQIMGYGAIKVIGLQTTLPDIQGGANKKKMVSIYPDGRLGID